MAAKPQTTQKLVIDTVDYRGKRVIFTEKKLKQKSITHPELTKAVFLKNVQTTIESPTEVWPDYESPKEKNCYYKKYSQYSYVKVVIYIKSNPCNVVTAYEINYVKEVNYPNTRQIR